MSGLRDLYQELILDHGKSPRNHRPMDDCTHQAHAQPETSSRGAALVSETAPY